MALELQAALSPASLPSLSDAVTMSITNPQQATDVRVLFNEVDQWFEDDAKGGRVAVTRFDFVGQFKGTIVAGKFKGVLDSTNDNKPGVRTLNVHIDGEPAGSTHQLFVNPDRNGEVEGGVLEIELIVEAKVNGRQLVYRSPAPLFVRSVIKKRPILTFLVGSDHHSFFDSAKAYWRNFGDVVDERHRTLDAMLDFLADASNRPTAEPWGEVNIVTHGEDTGPRGTGVRDEFSKLFFPWKPGVNPKNDPITAELLEREKNNPLLQRPDASSLDQNSRVVIRGCEIGPDQNLLDALRERFGGRAVVLAPKMVQKYAEGAPPSEALFQYFFIFLTGDRTAGIPRGGAVAPAIMRECVAAFQRKYPNVLDDAGWQALLNQRDSHLRRVAAESTGEFITDFASAPPKGHDFDDDARDNFKAKVSNDGPDSLNFTKFDDWKWRHRITPDRLHVTSVGVRTRIDVRRLSMAVDPNTKQPVPAVPNPSDPNQYGRSPSNLT